MIALTLTKEQVELVIELLEYARHRTKSDIVREQCDTTLSEITLQLEY